MRAHLVHVGVLFAAMIGQPAILGSVWEVVESFETRP